MFLRLFTFLAFQALGASLGWIIWPQDAQLPGLLFGVLLGSLMWVLYDLTRGLRVMAWLREGDLSEVPLKIGIWGDVSDRVRRLMRARTQLTRESEARLQDFLAALQASPNGVLLLDAQGRIEWFNQTAALHFGLDTKRDVQQHLVNLVRDPAFASYVAGGDYSQDVAIQSRTSSVSRPVRLSVQLHPYGDRRSLLLSRDITILEQVEAIRRDFVANVSHEIRTPLTVLSGFVETLQSLPLNEKERATYLELMAQQAFRMQSLVNDLLMLSRLEGSPLPSMSEWILVSLLFKQIEQEAKALSASLDKSDAPKHVIRFDVNQNLEISGLDSELHSAMSNLVNNAVRYTPAGGEVHVSWRLLEDGRGQFTVEDTGAGIAAEHLPRLTERFYRVDRSRSRDSGGTGLGLAIVKHVVQRHGAELLIESTEGKGSQFSILFPANRLRSV